MSYKKEAIDIAFKIWRSLGQNIEGTIRELKKQGYMGISKPTIYDWMEKYAWQARATRADTAEQEVDDIQMSFEETLIKSLVDRKKAYEEYFEKTPSVIDHQAQYAFAGIIKTLFDIKTKMQKITRVADDVSKVAKKSGLSAEAAAEIREKILGITK